MQKNFKLKKNGAVVTAKWEKNFEIAKKVANFFLACLIAFFVAFCLSHSMKIVVGLSMQPTLNKNGSDIVLFDKYAKFEKQDIVIVDFSEFVSKNETVIKRVIATEGDTLKIDWNDTDKLVVTVNGKVLKEDYIKQSKKSFENFRDKKSLWKKQNGFTLNDDGSITLCKGFFFVLGDNRAVSEDSSSVGPIENSKVLGVVDTIFDSESFVCKAIKFVFSIN